MTHSPKWRALSAYHAGALGPAGRRRVERHLAECERCAEALARVRAYEASVAEVRAQPTPAVPERLGAEAAALAHLGFEVRAEPVPPVPDRLGAEAVALVRVAREASEGALPSLDWDAMEARVLAAVGGAGPSAAEASDGHAPKWRALLAYHEEALSPDGRTRLERHLERCPVCREALASMGAYDEVADSVRGAAPEVAFERIEPSVRRAAHRRRRQRWFGAAAAVLAAAAAVALWLRPTPRPIEPPRVAVTQPSPPEVTEPARLQATVVAVGGDVRVGERGVALGTALQEEDALALAPGAALHVRLASGTGFAIAGSGELALSRLRADGVALALRRGRVVSQVRTGTHYAVEAGPYRVQVRGTRFEVRRDGERVAVTVDEGVVEVLREGALVALLPAPAFWSSHDDFEAAPLGSLRAPRGLSDAAAGWGTIRLAPSERFARWEIDGETFDAAGGLAMRAPLGPLTLVAYDGRGRRYRAEIEVAEEGALVEDPALVPDPIPTRQGTLRAEDIQAVVQPSVGRMQRCYERILRRMNPELEGTYALRVTVQRDGSVRRVRVITDADAPPPFVACLEGIARRWQFPSPEGGPTATFRLPLRFGVSTH